MTWSRSADLPVTGACSDDDRTCPLTEDTVNDQNTGREPSNDETARPYLSDEEQVRDREYDKARKVVADYEARRLEEGEREAFALADAFRRRYEQGVEQAAGALKRADKALWELARLTYENATPSEDPCGEHLEEWSRQVEANAVIRFTVNQALAFAQRWLERVDNPPASFLEGCNRALITPLPVEARKGR